MYISFVVQEGDKLPRGSIKLELKKLKLHSLQAQLRSQVRTNRFQPSHWRPPRVPSRIHQNCHDKSAFSITNTAHHTPWSHLGEAGTVLDAEVSLTGLDWKR